MAPSLTRLRHARLRDLLSGFLMSLAVFGCTYLRKPAGPIPTAVLPAPQASASRSLVIVLPGRGDDLDDLKRSGMAEAVQRAWPQADVLLAGATLGYYAEGKLPERLHQEIIMPARVRGYREIWLTGASMGAMGALLYERAYPGDVTGLVFYAPYMGAPGLIRQVGDAGGPARWDPGPIPSAVDDTNYQTEIWRLVKGWQDPQQARRIWLMCGDEDRFIDAARLIAPLLPADHFIQTKGGHAWRVWDAGAEQVFARIAALPR